jgi:hypothetical protein
VIILSVLVGLGLALVLVRDPFAASGLLVLSYGASLSIPPLVKASLLRSDASFDFPVTWIDIVIARVFWTGACLPFFIVEPWIAAAGVLVATGAGVGLQRPALPRAFRMRWAMAGGFIAFVVFVSGGAPGAILVALFLLPLWAAWLVRAELLTTVSPSPIPAEAHKPA